MLKTQTRWTHGFFQGCMANKLSIPKCFIVGFLCSIMLAVNVAFQLKTLKFRFFFFHMIRFWLFCFTFAVPLQPFIRMNALVGITKAWLCWAPACRYQTWPLTERTWKAREYCFPHVFFSLQKACWSSVLYNSSGIWINSDKIIGGCKGVYCAYKL